MTIGDVTEKLANRSGWDALCPEGAKAEAVPAQVTPAAVIARPTGVSPERMDRLVRTIEGEIVPRLVMARRVPRAPEVVRPEGNLGPDSLDVNELVRLLLAHDVSVASAYIETVRQRGATLELVCLELLAPAARLLGLMWERDECDFMQVTVGLCRLHQLLRELSPEFRAEDEEAAAQNRNLRRILLVPCPGDQHTFGISLVAQFLRRAGWDVWHEFPAASADILEIVSNHWLAVVGLSVGKSGAARGSLGYDSRHSRRVAQSRGRSARRRPGPGRPAGACAFGGCGCNGGGRSPGRAARRIRDQFIGGVPLGRRGVAGRFRPTAKVEGS